MDEDANPRRPPVWATMEALGEPEVIRGFGGTVSPLLAGFALAAIAQIVTSDPVGRPPMAEWSASMLGVAAICLVLTMEKAFIALRYCASVGERTALNPWTMRWEPDLIAEREEQHKDVAAAEFYGARASKWYERGLLSLLVALLLLLWPERWEAANVAGVAATALMILYQLMWAIRPLSPERDDGRRRHLIVRLLTDKNRAFQKFRRKRMHPLRKEIYQAAVAKSSSCRPATLTQRHVDDLLGEGEP